jgi:hypothetical protein
LNKLIVTEFKDIRVLTTQQLAESYQATTDTITKNFNRNKERYLEGKHYICLEGEELREFRANGQIDLSPNVNKLYLWTEKGAFLHAKSLNTDKAWEVYDHLVDTYFRAKKPLTAIEQLQLTQQALLEVNEKIDDVADELQSFKKDMPLLAIECDRITTAVKSKGVKCLGGKDSNAYQDKSLRGRVYSDIHGQLKREFGVSSYKAIKRSQCDYAIEIVNNYRLPLALEEEIENINSQIKFKVVI